MLLFQSILRKSGVVHVRKLLNSVGMGILGLVGGYLSTAFIDVMPQPCNVIKRLGNVVAPYSNCTAYFVRGNWKGETTSPKGQFPVDLQVNVLEGDTVIGIHNGFPFRSVAVESDGRFDYTFIDPKNDRHYTSHFKLESERLAQIIYSVRDNLEKGNKRFYEGKGTLSLR